MHRIAISAVSTFIALGAALVSSVGAQAATPAFVQGIDGRIVSGTSTSLAFPTNNGAGNLIVVYAVWSNRGSASVSDGRGNTYATAVGPTTWNSSRYRAQVFFASNSSAGPNTITVTFGTAISSFAEVYAYEYSGISTSSPLDVVSSATGTGTAMSSGAMTTTSANDLIFGAAASTNTVTQAGSGYTVRSTNYGNMTEDQVAATAGSYTLTGSQTGSGWAIQSVAFKATPTTGALGLAAYWTFDAGSGTVAADSSGSGNTGSLVNGPIWTTGQFSGALQFARSSSQYVNVPDAASLRIAGSWTVSAWLRIGAAPPDYSMIVAKNGIGTNYALQVNPSRFVCSYFDNGVVFGPSVCSTALNLNQWYMATAVWDSSSRILSIYVNGQLVNSQNITSMLPDARAGNPLTIGSDAPAFHSGYFTGAIDDIRVFNRVLSPSEILQVYTGAK